MADVQLPVSEGEVVAGKYRVDAAIGIGGMGVVVAATHLQLRERVALKLLRADAVTNADVVARFLREAQAAVRIKSENVARILDVGTHEGTPYIVMELLEGIDLRSLLKRHGPLPQTDAVDYIVQACRAIAEAHSLGIVHRDVKPANLFLTRRADGSPLVKVLDFGISKATSTVDGKLAEDLTLTSTIIGSPHFISPEQARSARRADARADVWSLGVVLYNLLTGTFPFEGETMTETLVAVLTETPAPLRARRGDVHPLLEAVILRCLAKDPAERFHSIPELSAQLAPFGSHAPAPSRYDLAGASLSSVSPLAQGIAIDDQPTAATWGAATDPPVAKPTLSLRRLGLAVALGIASIAALFVTVLAWRAHSPLRVAAQPSPEASASAIEPAPPLPSAVPVLAAAPSATQSAEVRKPLASAEPKPAPRPAAPPPAPPVQKHGPDLTGVLDTRK